MTQEEISEMLLDAVLEKLVEHLPLTRRQAFIGKDFTDLPGHAMVAAFGLHIRGIIRPMFQEQLRRAIKVGAKPEQIVAAGMKSIDFPAIRAQLPEILR